MTLTRLTYWVAIGLWVQAVSASAQGTVTTPIGSLADESFALALDPSGKIVVAGYTDQGTHDDFAIVRYNPDFTLDTTFDSDGIATYDMGGEDDRFNAVAVQPDGKIVAAGFFWTVGTNDMAVLRYNVDGTLDTTFDGDGIATVTMAGDDQARAVAIQDDGKIVISGYTNGSGNYDFVVVRFNADGSKDTTFDGDGIAETDFGGIDNKAEAVAVQSDGKIVAAGDFGGGVGQDYMVVRYNTDGTLDTGFDTDGIQTTDFLSDQDSARFIVVQSDGKIVVNGTSGNGVDLDFSVARYNTDGSLDTGFDTDGKVVTDFGGFELSFGAALGPGNAILVSGHSNVGGTFDFAVARYNSNGSLDTTFDTDGKVTTPIGLAADVGFGVAVESSGNIVVGGSANTGSDLDVAVVRYCPNGSLVTDYSDSFGYRKPLTLFASEVAGSTDLVDFPVLVHVTDPDLRTTANGGQVRATDGADIIFREACRAETLDHEVELYVPTTGELVAWVRVPLLRHDIDTSLFLYYGNASVGCPTENPAGVWSNSYHGVWHLQENPGDPAPQFVDSTSGANHGTAVNGPSTTTGRIENALLFDDTNERHVLVPHDARLQLPDAMTVSVWVNTTDTQADVGLFVMKWDTDPLHRNYWLGKFSDTDLSFFVDDTQSVTADITLVNDGFFHHVMGVADAANNLLRLYVDGVEVNNAAYTGTSRTGVGDLVMGRGTSPLQDFGGILDEVRVASAARSQGWVETEFRNQNNPGNFLSLGAEQAAPFDAPWVYGHRKKITIDNTKVCGSTNLLDFPVLVSLVDPDLRTVANGGKLEHPNGYDIVFRDSTAQNNLAFEVEQYVPTDGTLVAWVQVPSVSFNTDTDIYLYYGNAAVSCARQTASPTLVWDSSYKGVWHLSEDPTDAAPQVLDSTTHRNHGTSFGDMTSGDQIAGQIDGSLDFDGLTTGGDYIDNGGDSSLLMGSGDFTLEAWFKTTDTDVAHFAGKGSAGLTGKRYFMTMGSFDCPAGHLKGEIDDDSGAGKKFVCSSTPLNDDVWYHGALVRDGSNLRLYVNGAEDATPTDITGYGSIDNAREFLMASHWDEQAGPGIDETARLAGHLDEVRVSNVARSACWLETQFANQSSPGTFYNVGIEESGPGLAAAVSLSFFTAEGRDGEVLLEWRTASELDNLGFHLYRAASEGGVRERVTDTVIPGLGSSPVGASYSYRDTGVANGVTYEYWLEDIETTGKTKLHGPVSATPRFGVTGNDDRPPDESDSRIVFGEPSENAFRVVSWNRRRAVVELETHGFYAEPLDDGTVAIEIPGFEEALGEDGPSLPVKRTWVEAVTGRNVSVGAVRSSDALIVGSLQPSGSTVAAIDVSPRGTVRAARRRVRGVRSWGPGLYPENEARIVSVGFQGDTKKALLELAPLRWDAAAGRLTLTRRLEIHVLFHGRDVTEQGRRSRRAPSSGRRVLARFHTRERGLYRVRYEDIAARRLGRLSAGELRLSRQGKTVAFRLEPDGAAFERGSSLYFVSAGAAANPYGDEAVYELALEDGGATMEASRALPGELQPHYRERREREENRYYQAALLEAPDLWLWDLVFAPETKSYAIGVDRLVSSGPPATLTVWLQGASDAGVGNDHHVRIYVNGVPIAETIWGGKHAKMLEAELPAGSLKEGENAVEIENVGDTGAPYSMVMLDRFAVEYSRSAEADGGRLEGTWVASGLAEVSGLVSGASVVDVTDDAPRWIIDARASGSGTVRFGAEAGRRYLVVGPEAVLTPTISMASQSGLRATTNGADYLVIGPEAYLAEAEPLLALRREQGLRVVAATVEDIYAEFGFGEKTPQSIRDFVAYAYHYWRGPSLRYVLLLGDGTFDFKDYLGTGVVNQVPPLMIETTYLWTASDPTYGAVNGDDILPDVAVGRIPASSLEEVHRVVGKIVRFETGDRSESGGVFLIADNPDEAGDFEHDADSLATGVLSGKSPSKIFLRQLGREGTRRAVREAFDGGAEMMSYLGHGGIHLWAHENVFNLGDVDALAPQSQQPLLLTMNCLNGYFHFPYFDSLSERLLEAPGRGVIAAFSPSGLSLNAPAHLYHRALLEALVHGSHDRLGDAILEAQEAYADTGAFPELLSIYVLLGDPALTLR